MKIIEIIPFLPIDKKFSYLNSNDSPVQEMDIISVPFGPRTIFGLVVNTKEEPESVTEAKETEVKNTEEEATTKAKSKIKLKPINCIIAKNIINPILYKFIIFAASYNADYIGNFVKLSFPFAKPFTTKKPTFNSHEISIAQNASEDNFKKSKKWLEIHNVLKNTNSITVSELCHTHDISQNIIKSLIKKELISIDSPKSETPSYHLEENSQNSTRPTQIDALKNANLPPLSEGQNKIYEEMLTNLIPEFSVSILHGETGSGKTEVYLWLLKYLFNTQQDAQALIMIPEISLANTMQERLTNRFSYKQIIWHSNISSTIKQKTYVDIFNGETALTISTRSGLFLPYKNLKLIIIDEEHDLSYKQSENPIYGARDMAIARAKFLNIPIILLSATPSIETFVNTLNKKYSYYRLKERFALASMPNTQLIDLKLNPNKGKNFISEESRLQIHETLKSGHQVMIFINRRGYAPIITCTSCGKQLSCKYCDISLTEHKLSGCMKCHQCGYATKIPTKCYACNATDTLKELGAGVERIMEEVQSFVPSHYEVGLFTSDTMSTTEKAAALVQKIYDNEINIIIGTQIISKGYHFPNLKFVCIIDGDCIMRNDDYKSAEKVFQIMSQVIGRSGRVGEQGQVHIQTYNKDNKLLKAIADNDQDTFYSIEVHNRKQYFMPPFSRYVAIIFSGKDSKEILKYARQVTANLSETTTKDRESHQINILGPTAAVISYIRLRYRFRILIIAKRNYQIQSKIVKTLSSVPRPNNISYKIDIDPVNFF